MLQISDTDQSFSIKRKMDCNDNLNTTPYIFNNFGNHEQILNHKFMYIYMCGHCLWQFYTSSDLD